MSVSAVLVEVVVGELQLTEPTPPPPNTLPLAPIVAVQVCSGALCYIPFLTPDHVLAHLKLPPPSSEGLPRQVEKSYREGGRFIFHRGKSCLFPLPQHTPSPLPQGTTAQVVVLNGLCYPPTVFGRCERQLSVLQDDPLQSAYQGTLAVLSARDQTVAHLTLSISCRYLEGVGLYTRALLTGPANQTATPGVLSSHGQVTEADQIKVCQMHNTEHFGSDSKVQTTPKGHQDNVSAAKVNISQFGGGQTGLDEVLEIDHELNQNTCKSDLTEICKSEQTAIKLAELCSTEEELSYHETLKPSTVIENHENEKLEQPAPIYFSSQNPDGERLWNLKMENLWKHGLSISSSEHIDSQDPELQGETEQTPQNHNNHSCESNNSESSSSVNQKVQNLRKIRPNFPKSISNVEKGRHLCRSEKGKVHYPHIKTAVHRPTGWLRSTPPVTSGWQGHGRPCPPPRANRAHFLRCARLDPQLAHQLHTEISHQVKLRLKHFDETFLALQLSQVGKKMHRKSRASKVQTVGCQAVTATREHGVDPHRPYQRNVTASYSSSVEALSEQSPSRSSNRTTSSTESNKFSNVNNCDRSDIKASLRQLIRNATFDVDVTTTKSDGVNHKLSDYEEKFESASVSETSNVDAKSYSAQSSTTRKEQKITRDRSRSSSSSPSSVSKDNHEYQPSNNNAKTSINSRANKLQDIHGRSTTFTSSEAPLTYTIRKQQSSVDENVAVIHQQPSKSSSVPEVPRSDRTKADNRREVSEGESKRSDTVELSEECTGSGRSSEACRLVLQQGHQADVLTRYSSHKPGTDYYSSSDQLETVDECIQSSSDVAGKSGQYEGSGSGHKHMTRTSSTPEQVDSAESLNSCSDDSVHAANIDKLKEGPLTRQVYQETRLSNALATSKSKKINDYSEITTSTSTRSNKKSKIKKQNKSIHSFGYVDDDSSNHPLNYDDLHILSDGSITYEKPKNKREAPTAGDVDRSISDISARIAALLLPKKLSVVPLNTDSVSSYIPSDVEGTLSSLSDEIVD